MILLCEVPAAKRRLANGTVSGSVMMDFVFDPTKPEYGLIPADFLETANSIAVLDRVDLLPFKVDDGITGRYVMEVNQDGTITSARYREGARNKFDILSYREAFCKIYDPINKPIGNKVLTINCNGIARDVDAGIGKMSLLDPKKVF